MERQTVNVDREITEPPACAGGFFVTADLYDKILSVVKL